MGVWDLQRRLIAALWALRLFLEQLRDLGGTLAAIWDGRPDADWLREEERVMQTPPHDVGAATMAAPGLLASPRRTYRLQTKLAAGDLCDVHLAEAEGRQYVVKAPRVAVPAADRLMKREMRILRRLVDNASDDHHRLYFPQPVESFLSPDGRRLNVLAWREGLYTAGEIATRAPAGLDGRHLAWMFKRVLAALGYVHRHGWVHGAVTPPHLLFHVENHGLCLAGWIHAVRIGQPLTIVPGEFKSWYPPEARQSSVPATDIYLAAKSMVYLAGGDPVRDTLPDHVPHPLRQFLRACLLESPRMRPEDAWALHEELDDLLAEVYGPPQYVRLEM
jgi:serine/threonine protein kinase